MTLVGLRSRRTVGDAAGSLFFAESQFSRWKQHAITIAGGNGWGEGLDQLSFPFGIFVDGNKSVLIADWANHRVVRWERGAKTGTVVAGGNGQGDRIDQLNGPIDVLVDQRNRSIVIADPGNRRVVRWFEGNARRPEILIDNIECLGVAMDKEGFLYVSDVEKQEVRRWKEGEGQGTIVAGGNGEGDRLDQLNCPVFLFVDGEGSVYVSDCGNDRVMKWRRGAREGVIVAGGNGLGEGLNQLFRPHGVLVDQWRQIYVADWGNARMMRWREGESEGEVLVGGNGEGQGSNQLFRPTGLSFDDDGNLYVADSFNHRVQKFGLVVT